MTQAGEPIEDNTIVEFNFDLTERSGSRCAFVLIRRRGSSATKEVVYKGRTTGERRSEYGASSIP
jgi:hypothetical protein